uniref:Tumor necrosis factor receptor superfamily member 12A n=1 Tax=Camelus bactrianus TaxID=9837 RepID=A0A9W3HEB0_CAMBA|nr:tumor necrosis factor receptor superfamily member 12A isoform X2 [Camelus bactrianus]
MVPGSLCPLLRLFVLGLGLVLLGAAAGERVPGTTPCSRGSSWSADLDKCMDCASCPTRPNSDFCLGCAAAPPASFRLLWPILGGALSLALVLALLSGFLVWRRCRRREKFTRDRRGGLSWRGADPVTVSTPCQEEAAPTHHPFIHSGASPCFPDTARTRPLQPQGWRDWVTGESPL